MKNIRYKEYTTRSGYKFVAPKHVMDKMRELHFTVNICGKPKYKSLQVFKYDNGKKEYIGMLTHFIKPLKTNEYITFKDNNSLNLRMSNLIVNTKYSRD